MNIAVHDSNDSLNLGFTFFLFNLKTIESAGEFILQPFPLHFSLSLLARTAGQGGASQSGEISEMDICVLGELLSVVLNLVPVKRNQHKALCPSKAKYHPTYN